MVIQQLIIDALLGNARLLSQCLIIVKKCEQKAFDNTDKVRQKSYLYD